MKQISMFMKQSKAYSDSVVSQKAKLFLVLLISVVFGFALCFIIFWANFANCEKSLWEEIEMLKQKVVSLEQSLKKPTIKLMMLLER